MYWPIGDGGTVNVQGSQASPETCMRIQSVPESWNSIHMKQRCGVPESRFDTTGVSVRVSPTWTSPVPLTSIVMDGVVAVTEPEEIAASKPAKATAMAARRLRVLDAAMSPPAPQFRPRRAASVRPAGGDSADLPAAAADASCGVWSG